MGNTLSPIFPQGHRVGLIQAVSIHLYPVISKELILPSGWDPESSLDLWGTPQAGWQSCVLHCASTWDRSAVGSDAWKSLSVARSDAWRPFWHAESLCSHIWCTGLHQSWLTGLHLWSDATDWLHSESDLCTGPVPFIQPMGPGGGVLLLQSTQKTCKGQNSHWGGHQFGKEKLKKKVLLNVRDKWAYTRFSSFVQWPY